MDFNEVKELITLIDASAVTDVDICFENLSLTLSKCGNSAAGKRGKSEQSNLAVREKSASVVSFGTDAQDNSEDTPITILPNRKPPQKEGNIVTSPLVGTFYSCSGPGKEPFASVGVHVKKGDVLCIVEAMKIMNEITSDFDGEVAEILAKDEEFVEYGQPLFRIV